MGLHQLIRQVEMEKLLTKSFLEMKSFGVKSIFIAQNDDTKQAYWVGEEGNKEFIPSERLMEILSKHQSVINDDLRDEINSFLPTVEKFADIIWNEFELFGLKFTALFTGVFVNKDLIFSKFRSIIDDIYKPDGYNEIAQALQQLKEDHKLIVKGERIAAILETAVAINHEINNPLTAILGNTQLLLLERDNLSESVISKLETVEKSALRIRQVTKRLMQVVEPTTKKYTDCVNMLDIEKSSISE